MPSDPRAETRASYPHVLPIATRWMDNDVYGHVNNVVYYAYFDTVINRYLIEEGGLDIRCGETVGLCVESHCAYLRPIAFPDVIDVGLRVAHLGRTSARYEIGIFTRGSEPPSAHGWFVHVFVDRATRRPSPLPASIRDALERLTLRTEP